MIEIKRAVRAKGIAVLFFTTRVDEGKVGVTWVIGLMNSSSR